jgi:quercetin dioxygenase-like cupin family protein
MNENPTNRRDVIPIENPPGVQRRTLRWNDDAMLCHFEMRAGAQIPLHSHPAVQIGYVVSGRLRFITEDGGFEVSEGHSYVFASNEKHGADIVEDAHVIEVFTPMRPEYAT